MRDISGIKFGRATAVQLHHSGNHRRFWTCICDCGNVFIARQDQLVTGKTRSCGCLLRESQLTNMQLGRKPRGDHKQERGKKEERKAKYQLKHQYPRLYRIWSSMKSRCYYHKNKCFHYYGGRGISICDEWLNSFNTFATWALCNGYADDLSIDRINVDGNYCPQNCRWATNDEQQKNKRKSSPQKCEELRRSPCSRRESGRKVGRFANRPHT